MRSCPTLTRNVQLNEMTWVSQPCNEIFQINIFAFTILSRQKKGRKGLGFFTYIFTRKKANFLQVTLQTFEESHETKYF